jgi:hypothetical protein
MKRKPVIGSTVAAALSIYFLWNQPALARQQSTSPVVDKEATAALERMGRYLRSLKTFQVQSTTTMEDVLTDGQKVQYTGTVMALARIPDRLRMSIENERRDRLYVYDGKQLTVLARGANTYATVPAPPTIAQLSDMLDQKYGLEMPLEDLFHWGETRSATAGITSAMLVGPSQIGGVTCAHYAFRQEGLDWQVWIQQGDHPLPRKLVLTTTTDEARPQYTAVIDWNLAPAFNDQAFTFVAPKGAGRAVLAGITQEVTR